jgi:hypothetical protein
MAEMFAISAFWVTATPRGIGIGPGESGFSGANELRRHSAETKVHSLGGLLEPLREGGRREGCADLGRNQHPSDVRHIRLFAAEGRGQRQRRWNETGILAGEKEPQEVSVTACRQRHSISRL